MQVIAGKPLVLHLPKSKKKLFVQGRFEFSVLHKKLKNIAKKYYKSTGCDIDIIHLNGSIEIAPILDLSDVIVDIVETGKTLIENNLKPFTDIVPISARLIANKSGYKFKKEIIKLAYDKCVDANGKFSFPYIHKILETWHKENVKSVDDVRKLSENKNQGAKEVRKTSYDIEKIKKKVNDFDNIRWD